MLPENRMPYSQILVNTEQLGKIVSDLAQNIQATYKNMDNCLALVVMDGAKYFAEDLLAKLDFPLEVEYIKASSYSGTNSTGTVKTDKKDSLKEKIHGKNILLIDDIYDTGLTLSHILEWLDDYRPETVTTCVLLEKEVGHTKKVDIDFLGTMIEDEFLIGYGLDFNGQYRDLPFIGVLSNKVIKQDNPAYKP